MAGKWSSGQVAQETVNKKTGKEKIQSKRKLDFLRRYEQHMAGRESTFRWIPARRALYVGVGGGMMEYKFSQSGDFIDFETTRVFFDEYISQGWTPVAQANAGLDLALGRFALLNIEGRYTYAQAPMSSDFKGFNQMDLSGMAVTAGISLRL